MRVLSWNVDGTFPPNGSTKQIKEQIEWIESLETVPDVLMLQEVNLEKRDFWFEELRSNLCYQHLADTIELGIELGNSNGHITAARNGWELSENKFARNDSEGDNPESLDLEYPEKILITDLGHPTGKVQLLNVRAVPGGSYELEKLKILETVYDWISNNNDSPSILTGDFNTPKSELQDGQVLTFADRRDEENRRRGLHAELSILKGLGHFGLIDVFRSLNGFRDVDTNEESHDGRRVDHLFATEELSPVDCFYPDVIPDLSDHNPVVADFKPQ